MIGAFDITNQKCGFCMALPFYKYTNSASAWPLHSINYKLRFHSINKIFSQNNLYLVYSWPNYQWVQKPHILTPILSLWLTKILSQLDPPYNVPFISHGLVHVYASLSLSSFLAQYLDLPCFPTILSFKYFSFSDRTILA